jgi:hypothetical protein
MGMSRHRLKEKAINASRPDISLKSVSSTISAKQDKFVDANVYAFA